jgi:hypothetical protein
MGSTLVAEQFADSEVGEERLTEAASAAEDAVFDAMGYGPSFALDAASAGFAVAASDSCVESSDLPADSAPSVAAKAVATSRVDDEASWEAARRAERAEQSRLLQDITGPVPALPTPLDPAWLTPTVSNLAQAAYEVPILPSGELDPIRLAVLSDALEEAGCDDADILGHLRSPGPHVRGCWAVDLLLGKE